MTYSRFQQLKPEDFKRLCGVHHQTFTQMVTVLEEQVEQRKKKPGKPSKLSVADQVLITHRSRNPRQEKYLLINMTVSSYPEDSSTNPK